MKNLIRLFVMTKINHNEEYYQNAMKSRGIDYRDLTHYEIALFKATMKQIEADLMIEASSQKEKISRNDFDYSKLLPKNDNKPTN